MNKNTDSGLIESEVLKDCSSKTVLDPSPKSFGKYRVRTATVNNEARTFFPIGSFPIGG